MSVGSRLREERLRMGLSQPAFASIAGVTKGALVKWEKDDASPNAAALIAFAGQGADAVYILTGRRLPGVTDGHHEWIETDLAEIESELVEPLKARLPDESAEQTDARLIAKARKRLQGIVDHDSATLPTELAERAKALLEAASDPHSLSLLRAADFAQARQRREHEKDMLWIWLNHGDYHPDHSVVDLMARIALDYRVPPGTLVELANEIYRDVEEQRLAIETIQRSEKDRKG